MRKFTDLTLASAGATDEIERGEIKLEKGEKLMGLRLRCTVPVNNVSGGAVTLSDAQKRVLLSLLTIELCDFGKSGKFATPFVEMGFDAIRRHQLRCYRNEMESFNSTTANVGMQQSFANGATQNCIFTIIVPLGKWAAHKGAHRNRWGMGRSQAETLKVKVRRNTGAGTILAGVTILAAGSVTIDVLDDSLPCKGDVWNPVPQVRRIDDARLAFSLEEGLPLAIDELTTTHAASALTNISLKIDDQYIHRQISLQQTIEQKLDADDYPAAALLTGECANIYETADGEVPFDQLPTGTPQIIQETRQLALPQISYTYLPIDSAEKLTDMVRTVAIDQRKKDILAISAARPRGERLSPRHAPYGGIVLLDRDDREFEQFPGLFASVNAPGVAAAPMIPRGLLETAQAKVNAHKSAREDKAATGIVDELAASVPGAVQGGRGFSRGNTAMRSVIESRYFR